MRRVWLLVLALAIPSLAGFECTISTEPWVIGGDCDYWLEYDDATCSGTMITYCAADNFVYSDSCANHCPGGDGYCDISGELGYNACICPAESPELPLPGEACDWSVFTPAYNVCVSSTVLDYCDSRDATVYALDCAALCGGTCDYDWDDGVYDCICPDWQWAAGYACNYLADYASSTCGGNELTYCAEDNMIYAADCATFCAGDPYFADGGTCGVMAGSSANGCNCTYSACDFDPRCYDAQFLEMCDPSTGSYYVDCDSYCRTEMGATKGACQYNNGTDDVCWCL